VSNVKARMHAKALIKTLSIPRSDAAVAEASRPVRALLVSTVQTSSAHAPYSLFLAIDTVDMNSKATSQIGTNSCLGNKSCFKAKNGENSHLIGCLFRFICIFISYDVSSPNW
jgi:hypothetical protein